MKVERYTQERFKIGPLDVTREEASAIYDSLGPFLGKPTIEFKGCGDRMSHGPHSHGKRDSLYCTGRSFDAT